MNTDQLIKQPRLSLRSERRRRDKTGAVGNRNKRGSGLAAGHVVAELQRGYFDSAVKSVVKLPLNSLFP